jgi:peroxiredoxin
MTLRVVLFRLAVAAALVLAPAAARAGADEDWAAIVALDAGPQKTPGSREEVLLLARTHFAAHRRAVEAFLAAYPTDPRVFDAQLRRAALLAAEGKMDGDPKKVDAAFALLTELEKNPDIPREKLATAGFQRVSLYLQNQRGSTDRMRESIVQAARQFTAKYPGDRRGPRLLVEAATICDDAPTVKRQLLLEAERLTTEEPLKRRIADDLIRLGLLGHPLDLRFTAVDGRAVSLEALRGQVVVVIFWSAESPHSLLWLGQFRAVWEKLPKDRLRVVTISLDTDRRLLDEKRAELPADWPVHFDGKGWDSPLARKLGINALPSVWVIEKKGILRTLNAREGYETWIRQLLRE